MFPSNDNSQNEQLFILGKAREMLLKCGYVDPASEAFSIDGPCTLLNNAFGSIQKMMIAKA